MGCEVESEGIEESEMKLGERDERRRQEKEWGGGGGLGWGEIEAEYGWSRYNLLKSR